MEIKPIDAVIYNKEKVNMNEVIAPPYDVIDDNYRNNLYERSKYNIVRLILSKENDPYQDAKNNFENWKKEGVLIKTERPAIFYIIQKYTNEKGKLIERKGFIARNKIHEFEDKKILPHEFTMSGPKQDRFNLVSATKAFFSQIFLVYNDNKFTIETMVKKYLQKPAYFDVVDDLGVQNLVYLIDEKEDIELIQNTLEDKTFLIADGHHRYETSLKYSKEHPDNEKAKYVMSYFTNASDENLIIYPTHRVIEKQINSDEIMNKVQKYYDVEKIQDKEEFLNKIEIENKKQITTGLILKNDANYYVLKLKQGANKEIDAIEPLKNLDLTVLHEIILKKELGFSQDELMSQTGIKYIKQENTAFDAVKNGASAVFIMAYPKMKDILDISNADHRMPQKSTYFYPKLLSGLVINPLESK